MKCEMFRKGINAFKSRPLLYQRLIKQHQDENLILALVILLREVE